LRICLSSKNPDPQTEQVSGEGITIEQLGMSAKPPQWMEQVVTKNLHPCLWGRDGDFVYHKLFHPLRMLDRQAWLFTGYTLTRYLFRLWSGFLDVVIYVVKD